MSPGAVQPADVVEIRAFRGRRKSSVYREHVVAAAAFVLMLDLARREGLTLLPALTPRGPHELDKDDTQRLAHELTSLRASGVPPELDDDLTAIAELARWCGRAGEDSWLRIAVSGGGATTVGP